MSEISEHLIPGWRLGPSRGHGPLFSRLMASPWHQERRESYGSPAYIHAHWSLPFDGTSDGFNLFSGSSLGRIPR